MVRTMEEANDIREFGTCECCGNKITDEQDDYYVNVDGQVFCSIECVLDHYNVVKIEV